MANNNLTATKSELINKLITAKQLIDAGKLTDGSFIPTIEKASSNDMDVYNAMTPYLEGNANSPVDSRVMDIYRTVPQYGSDRFKTITDRFNQIGSRLIENPNDQSVNNEFNKAKIASLSNESMSKFIESYNFYNKQHAIPIQINYQLLPNGEKKYLINIIKNVDTNNVDNYYNTFKNDTQNDSDLKNIARLNYYNNLLSNNLRNKNPELFDTQINDFNNKKITNIKDKVKYADSAIKNGFNLQLSNDDIKNILGNNTNDYNNLRDWYSKKYNVDISGENENTNMPSQTKYGLRNLLMVNPAIYNRDIIENENNKLINSYHTNVKFNPENNSYSYIYESKNKWNEVPANKMSELSKIIGISNVFPETIKEWINENQNIRSKYLKVDNGKVYYNIDN